KESGGNLDQITKIKANTPENFHIYSGDDNFTLPVLAIGGYGVVSVAGHVIGKDIRNMIEAYIHGDVAKAAALHGQLLPIFNGLFISTNPVPVKYALQIHGLPVGGVRLPLVDMAEEEKQFVKA